VRTPRNEEPNLADWAKFLSASADEDLEALAMENPVFKQAKEALDRLSADPEARVRAEMREMALASHELDRAKVRRESKAEGRAEGRAEATADLVRRLLTAKFGELSPEGLQKLARASDTELIEWSERLLFAPTLEAVFNPPSPT
jgi:hypothetical protein